MDPLLVAAALASAALHAGWNAAVKAAPRPAATMTAQMALSALIGLPVFVLVGLPQPAALPYVVVATALNMVAITALLRAYETAGFALAYPLVRALSVVTVVPLAALVAGEQPGPYASVGIALIALSLALVGFGQRGPARIPARALLFIGLSAVTTAAYVICDAGGARSAGSPLAYGAAVSITNALGMLAIQGQLTRAAALADLVRTEAVRALPLALASVTSYFLILWVFTKAPIAPAAALRDTSAVFAVVIAILFLKERVTGLRLAAVAVAALAVPLLRLG